MVIGMGNELLGDGGIGPRVVQGLKRYPLDACGVSFIFETLPAGGLEVIHLLSGKDYAFIIDAIGGNEAEPAEIRIYNEETYHTSFYLDNFHDFPLSQALRMARDAGFTIPENLEIIGIGILENHTFTQSLSPELKGRFNILLKHISDHICNRIRQQAALAI